MNLNDELDQIFAARDRNNMQPTIDALLPRYGSHPENARVLYEVGGAYDTAGQEDTARKFYEKALAAGLEGDLLRRCYVQYGSTLRNVGEYEKSLEVFAAAREAFPEPQRWGLSKQSLSTPQADQMKPLLCCLTWWRTSLAPLTSIWPPGKGSFNDPTRARSDGHEPRLA